MTIEGAPNNRYDIAVKFTKGGGFNEAALKYSFDGGVSFSPETTLPIDGILAILPTGLTLKFTAGETAFAAGVGKVLFKNLSYTSTNKSSQYAVTLEFWEYHPVAITATPANAKAQSTSAAPPLSADYQRYLDGLRGTSPKTGQTPAVDDRTPVYGGSYRDRLLYGD